MATLAIVLKTSKQLSNNEFSVALRITHNRVRKYFNLNSLIVDKSLPFRCQVKDWKPAELGDNGFGRFNTTVPNYKILNQKISEKLALAHKILNDYDLGKVEFDFKKFEEDLKGGRNTANSKKTKLSDYYEGLISELEKNYKMGTADVFKFTVRSIIKYKPDILLTDIDTRFLESFEAWLRNVESLMDTSISVKIRNLQRVINLAIADKLYPQENYPFGEKKYSVNKRLDHETEKIAISLDQVKKLKELKLQEGSSLHFAQQMFLFSFYCRGMNFIDMTFLKWSNIDGEFIRYTRQKTGGKFCIPLIDKTKVILDYFKKENILPSDFVFPIIDREIHLSSKQMYYRKKSALKAVNNNLKKLAKIIDIPNLKLTTNVGRHSYATGLKYAEVKTSYITEALGHSTETQTQIYLDSFKSDIIKELDSRIFDI